MCASSKPNCTLRLILSDRFSSDSSLSSKLSKFSVAKKENLYSQNSQFILWDTNLAAWFQSPRCVIKAKSSPARSTGWNLCTWTEAYHPARFRDPWHYPSLKYGLFETSLFVDAQISDTQKSLAVFSERRKAEIHCTSVRRSCALRAQWSSLSLRLNGSSGQPQLGCWDFPKWMLFSEFRSLEYTTWRSALFFFFYFAIKQVWTKALYCWRDEWKLFIQSLHWDRSSMCTMLISEQAVLLNIKATLRSKFAI